jgi:hypothetical protein
MQGNQIPKPTYYQHLNFLGTLTIKESKDSIGEGQIERKIIHGNYQEL